MSNGRIDHLRGIVMFIVAWLIALYVFEIVRQSFPTSVALVAAVLTLGVNVYARHRSGACVEGTWAFRFWRHLPVLLFILPPIAVEVVAILMDRDDRGWWAHFSSVLPFALKLGVPVFALLWVYFSLGRMMPKKSDEGVVEPT